MNQTMPDASAPSSARVALVACPSYEPETVRAAIDRCLELLGGEAKIIPSGGRALLKPNLLIGIKPERAVTTHPEVVAALHDVLQRNECAALLGDSPMFARPATAARKCGYGPLLTRDDLPVDDMTATTVVNVEGGHPRFKRFEVAKVVEEVDLIVNVCKLKTHGITGLTLAVKNLFGLIPGLEKSKWHVKAPSHEQMATMLVDLVESLTRHLDGRVSWLHVADAVLGLEGEGPGASGTPRQVGAIAASLDPVALDTVLAHLVGFSPDEVTTTPIAASRGLGCGTLEQIELVGDDIESLRVDDYQRCRRSVRSGAPRESGWPLNSKLVRDRLLERPLIDRDACTGCADCQRVCAAQAIKLVGEGKNKKAVIDHDRCIRCYCCSEVCRYSAAKLGPRPLLARIADHAEALPWVGSGLALIAIGAAIWHFWD